MAKLEHGVAVAADLRDLGIESPATAEQIIEKISGLDFRDTRAGSAAARVLGTIPDRRAAEILARVEPASTGELRREIRRAIFKLRQRGIEIPVAEPAPSRPNVEAAVSNLSALMSPIDQEGARIAWIIKSRREGGVTRLWGLASDSDGLVGATLVNISRRQLKEERQELERRASMKLVEADWRLADFVLCEAYRNTPDSRRGQVGNFISIRAEVIATAPPAELHHPIYDEVAEEIKAGPSIELLKEPEAAGLRIPEQVIKAYVEEVRQIQQSPLVLNRYQQEDRINTIVERAIGELLSGDNARKMKRRLEDTAYYLAHSGRRQPAGWAASAAALIGDNPDLKRVPFFQQLVRANLGEQFAHQQEEHKEDVRLVMTPAEAMRSQQQRARRP